MTPPILALDTETTGLHPGRQAWDVGMIRRDEQGEHVAQFFIEVDLADADPFALNIGRFYDRHPLGRFLSRFADEAGWPGAAALRDLPLLGDGIGDYLTPMAAAHVIATWTHGAHIVGAVPSFDTEVLGALLRDNGLTPAWHYHLVDCEALAVGWLAAQPRYDAIEPPWKSDDLSRSVGVEPPSDEDRHTALGDARWALAVYDRIVGANG